MNDFSGKKLLIIGGAFQHCKLVEAAHQIGVIVYVVDYLPLEKAPAKQISDFHFEYNITDYDEIIDMCKREHIDGVLSSHLDACQIPYQVICEKLGVPCFGTKEQFHILTDKTAFIETCRQQGVDVIPQYTEDQLLNHPETVEFPVFIKPCDSRGSRGQTICFGIEDAIKGVTYAKQESATKKVIIEKYMSQHQDFSMTYFVVEGEPYLIRLCDRYEGKKEDGLDKLCQGCMSPSKYTSMYMEYVDERIKRYIKSIGIMNGPVFMQGFVDGTTIRVYDPGLRFPGGEYERLLESATGLSLSKSLIEFALSGHISKPKELTDDVYRLNGQYTLQLDISLKPGIIKEISGLNEIRNMMNVYAVAQRYSQGDEISETHDVRQRLCEIAFTVPSFDDVEKNVNNITQRIKVTSVKNENMLVSVLRGKTFIQGETEYAN